MHVTGWAVDPEDKAPVTSVAVFIDGAHAGDAALSFARSDIQTLYGGSSAYLNSGWEFDYPVSSLALGTHTVTATAHDSAGASAALNLSATFQVCLPQITSLSPNRGGIGTSVTISGSCFPWTEVAGGVKFGTAVATVTSWNNTSLTVQVPDGLSPGTYNVSVTNGDQTSNTAPFTVVGFILSPVKLSLVVGDTYTLDALAADGTVLHGLPWSSSDLSKVELSSDDPPLLTAKAVGSATITAGNLTSTITVYAGPTLPVGTVKWEVPDDGQSVRQIIPAVPSATGVADVFTLTTTRQVQAITPDGHIAWRAHAYGTVVPDFQGGFLDAAGTLVQKYDGQTGQALPPYTKTNPLRSFGFLGVHTDGTIFVLDDNAVILVNPQTGQEKFRTSLATKQTTTSTDCPGKVPPAPTTNYARWPTQNATVAGDGYFYFNYYVSGTSSIEHCDVSTDANGLVYNHETKTTNGTEEFHLLRLASDGTAQDLVLYTNLTNSSSTDNIDRVQAGVDCSAKPLPSGCTEYTTGQTSASYSRAYSGIITHADQGVLLLWTEVYTPANGGSQTNTAKLTAVLGGQVGTDIPLQGLASPQQNQAMKLYLQLQNGDFVALRDRYDSTHDMLMAFNAATGEMHWTKPVAQYYSTPLYGTPDSGMIYSENGQLVTVDASGNELSRLPDDGSIYSWRAVYKRGSTNRIYQEPIVWLNDGFLRLNLARNAILAKQHELPESALGTLSQYNFTQIPKCAALLNQFATKANTTQDLLISQLQRAAAGARDYLYDGPSSSEPLDSAKFPGEAQPPSVVTVSQWFTAHSEPPYKAHGLSQFNGFAIYLRLNDWWGWFPNFSSDFITSSQVNYYGMGIVMHEVLHKQMVGGGFSHTQMLDALSAIQAPPATLGHEIISDEIGQVCFLNQR